MSTESTAGAVKVPARPPPLTRAIPLGPGIELRVIPVVERASVGEEPLIELRVFRPSPEDTGVWCQTQERPSLSLRQAGEVGEAIKAVVGAVAEWYALAPATLPTTAGSP